MADQEIRDVVHATDTTPGRYRKRPVVIEAIRWDGTAAGATPIVDWILGGGSTASYTCSNPDRCAANDGDTPHCITIQTLEGAMRATIGDWILRGVQGEFYPCKPDIFDSTYSPVEATAQPDPSGGVTAAHEAVAEVLTLYRAAVRSDDVPADLAARYVATTLRWAAENLTDCPWDETAEHGCDWPLMADRLRGAADEIDPQEVAHGERA